MTRLRLPVLLLAIACPGATCHPRPPPSADLRAAQAHVAAGQWREALNEYARIYESLAERSDSRAVEGRAQILLDLYNGRAEEHVQKLASALRDRLLTQVPALRSKRDLLSAAAGEFARTLSTTVDAEQHVTCATKLSEILQTKIERPELRRMAPAAGFEELLYRRLLRESIASHELFALVRQPGKQPRSGDPAAAAREALASDLEALAALPASTPAAVLYWNDRAAKARAAALQLRTKPGEAKIGGDTGAEWDVDAHLKQAKDAHDRAIRYLTGKEPAPLIIEAFEDVLRHTYFAQEAISDPSPPQQVGFTTATMSLAELKRLAQK